MSLNKRAESATAAVADIPDGASLAVGGFGLAGIPKFLIEALLAQPALFIKAGKSGHISRLYEADAGLAHLRFWLRFCSNPDRNIITLRQHQAAEVMIAEVGRILGSWIASKKGREPG